MAQSTSRRRTPRDFGPLRSVTGRADLRFFFCFSRDGRSGDQVVTAELGRPTPRTRSAALLDRLRGGKIRGVRTHTMATGAQAGRKDGQLYLTAALTRSSRFPGLQPEDLRTFTARFAEDRLRHGIGRRARGRDAVRTSRARDHLGPASLWSCRDIVRGDSRLGAPRASGSRPLRSVGYPPRGVERCGPNCLCKRLARRRASSHRGRAPVGLAVRAHRGRHRVRPMSSGGSLFAEARRRGSRDATLPTDCIDIACWRKTGARVLRAASIRGKSASSPGDHGGALRSSELADGKGDHGHDPIASEQRPREAN